MDETPPRSRSHWKARAARLLAENVRTTGRMKAEEVARKVRVSRRAVFYLASDLRRAHSELTA